MSTLAPRAPHQDDAFPEGVLLPGDDGWEAARRAFGLDRTQRPSAIAFAHSERDLERLARFAERAGLHLVTQDAFEDAASLGSLVGALLVDCAVPAGRAASA